MPYLVHPRQIEGDATGAQQPTECRILVGLLPVRGGLLEDTDRFAVPACPCHVAVRDLIRAHCPVHRAEPVRKYRLRKIQQRRTRPAFQQDRILLPQQVGCMRELGKDKPVVPSLKQLRQGIKAPIAEYNIGIGKPDPVRTAVLCGKVPPDTAPEQPFLRQWLPVPGDARDFHFAEEFQDPAGGVVLGGVVHRHRQVDPGTLVNDKGTELIGQEMIVSPTVTHDLQMKPAPAPRWHNTIGIDPAKPGRGQSARKNPIEQHHPKLAQARARGCRFPLGDPFLPRTTHTHAPIRCSSGPPCEKVAPGGRKDQPGRSGTWAYSGKIAQIPILARCRFDQGRFRVPQKLPAACCTRAA